MASNPRKNPQPRQSGARPAQPPRRHLRRSEIERQRQRLVVISTSVIVALIVVAIGAGLIYERVWLPSRPVAQVNGIVMTRGDYTTERRAEVARTIAQSLYLATFGEQFAQQFLDQIPQIDALAVNAATEPIDDALVLQWIDLQVLRQAAQSQYGIQISDDEVAQEFVALFGPSFAPPANVLTPTAILLPTLEPTATIEPTLGPGTPAPTTSPTPAEPTAPPPPPEPSTTPSPTPVADEARSRQQEAIQRLYDEYVNEMRRIDPQSRVHLTIEDFRIGLRDQFLRQVLITRVQEQLVPDAGFTPTTDPSSIETRHILLKVTVPLTGTAEEIEQAYAARLPEAEALLAEARAAADFGELARERTEDFNTKETGGTLPTFNATGATQSGTQIDPAIAAAVSGIAENEIVGPIRTSFGWHIVQLVRQTVDSPETQLTQARSEAFERWLNEQRTTISVQRFPTVEPSPTLLPTGTALPLPTAPLGGDPSPTIPPTPVSEGAPVEPTPTATTTP